MARTGFEAAFSSISDVVRQATSLPDRSTDEIESPGVTVPSPRYEVEVTVQRGRIDSLWLDESWLWRTPAAEAAALVATTINQALDEWERQRLETIEQASPQLQQLGAAVSAARQQLEDAWNTTLEQTRTP